MPETKLSLAIEGMHCGGCINRVTAALAKVAGVTVEKVEVGSAQVSYDPAAATPAQIADSVNRIGFSARASN
jgi:copper chaperone